MSGRGIAPTLLVSQVRNTAAWAFEVPNAGSWQSHLKNAEALQTSFDAPEGRLSYFSLMLAAHFTTVATFVPTDVDVHIRHHAWQAVRSADELTRYVERIDEAAMWDERVVSNRFVEDDADGVLSGHNGEWFSVRAGALGRAIELGATSVAERVATQIRDELARHARIYRHASENAPRDALCVATLLAHNLGDLSRVVDAWETKSATANAFRSEFSRLGHDARAPYGSTFVEAGELNKAMMAHENHRYLALRKPRALRTKKEFVIPFGPFFDAWGERIGSDTSLSERDLGEIVDALIQGVHSLPNCLAFTRALAGIHRRTKGGIDRIVKEQLPARTQRLAYAGPIREALRVPTTAFEARVTKSFESTLARLRLKG